MTDQHGVPSGIEFLFSYAVLRLPKQPKLNERLLFQQGAIGPDDADVWRTLSFSVSRFGPPRERPLRPIKWTKSDLTAILNHAKDWIDTQPLREQPKNQADEFWKDFAGIDDDSKINYQAWLQVIEEVVVLAPNRDDKQLQVASDLIQLAQQEGFPTLKCLPTLAQLGQMNTADVVREIRRGLASSDDECVWHATCEIVRWAELERIKKPIPLPISCLQALGILIMERCHKMLSLLLNTTRDLVGIDGKELDTNFQSEIHDSLTLLLTETKYSNDDTDWTVNRRIRLRQIALNLVQSLRDIGMEHPIHQAWIEAGRADKVEDVRRFVCSPLSLCI